MPRPPPTECEFHSCILIVDKITKSIFVFNPWKLGKMPVVMASISDIQPNLVRRIVKMYNPKPYKTLYLGGNQTHQPDCRYRIRIDVIGRFPGKSPDVAYCWSFERCRQLFLQRCKRVIAFAAHYELDHLPVALDEVEFRMELRTPHNDVSAFFQDLKCVIDEA
jgi:hypothetical protein